MTEWYKSDSIPFQIPPFGVMAGLMKQGSTTNGEGACSEGPGTTRNIVVIGESSPDTASGLSSGILVTKCEFVVNRAHQRLQEADAQALRMPQFYCLCPQHFPPGEQWRSGPFPRRTDSSVGMSCTWPQAQEMLPLKIQKAGQMTAQVGNVFEGANSLQIDGISKGSITAKKAMQIMMILNHSNERHVDIL